MKLITYILVFWLMVARFILGNDSAIIGNISALFIALFLIRFNNSIITQFTLVITLSVFYTYLLTDIPYSSLIGVISAFITYGLGFNTSPKWSTL